MDIGVNAAQDNAVKKNNIINTTLIFKITIVDILPFKSFCNYILNLL